MSEERERKELEREEIPHTDAMWDNSVMNSVHNDTNRCSNVHNESLDACLQ